MKHLYSLTIVAILSTLIPLSGNAQLASKHKIDTLLNGALDNTGPSSLILVNSDKVLYENSFATDPAERNTAKRYRIASGAKWLTSATILALADKDIVELDDKVSNYLPSFKGEKGNITLRQLLSHTSGLPANSVYIKNNNLSLKASVDSIAQHNKLRATPGKQFRYGGVSFQVAARVAEVATGKDWETIFHEQIARPCQMKHTDFGKLNHKDIGDGAYSNAEDYAKFLQMILNNGNYKGQQVLTKKAIDEMMADHTSHVPVGYTPYRFTSIQTTRFYGLGVWIDRVMVNDLTATEISSQGSRGFTPWVNTCKGIAGVFAVYGELKEMQPTIELLKNMVDEEFIDNCDDRLSAGLKYSLNEENSGGSLIVFANNVTKIVLALVEDSEVNLTLFDPLGNELEVLMDGQLKKGKYSFPIDASSLKPGVYFYKLTIDGKSETKKLVVSSNSSN